nr:SPFH domain-containing protein [uncultured Treponema sp.]
MKTFRTLLILVIVLLAGAGLVFFFGWTQFSIPAGKYGVMLSKSGGYYQKVITPGQLTWRWERLIPTNARIFVFDLAPRQVHYTAEGALPSADQYSKVLNIKDNFSWSFSVDALVTLKPEYLVAAVTKNGLQTQEGLETAIDSGVQAALQTLMHRYVSELLDNPYEYQQVKTDYHALSEKIKSELSKTIGPEFLIEDITLSKIVIPDIHTYKLAEQSYNLYEQQREMLLAETAAKEAQYAASEQFQIDRLTKWGDFLAKYPHIIELIAVAQQDSKAALNALKSIGKPQD